MRKNDRQLGTPFIDFHASQAELYALTGLAGGETAYAPETGTWGYYDGVSGTWKWMGTGNGDGGTSVHNDLTGLQGGNGSDEYYHFNSGTYANLLNSLEVLTADRTYYVRTDGSDSNDGLTNNSGGAFLTASKVESVINGINKAGYNIYVYFGSGTWNEDVNIPAGIGKGDVSYYGTLTLLETATSATVSAGSGATRGTVTKTGQFTGDNHTGKLAYFTTDDEYRVIRSNTNNALTLVGTAPSSTTQDVEIYDWATVFYSISCEKDGNATHIEISDAGSSSAVASASNGAVLDLTRCNILDKRVLANGAKVILDTCNYFYDGSGAEHIGANNLGNLSLDRSLIWLSHNTAFATSNSSYMSVRFGTTIDGDAGANMATYGLYSTGNGVIEFTNQSSSGYCFIENCDTGLYADNGGQITGETNTQYSGNTTNTNADAATFGNVG